MVLQKTVQAQQKASGMEPTNVQYNSRTADANATLQNAEYLQQRLDVIQQQRQQLLEQHTAGTITQEDYNRQNALLTQQATLTGTSLKQTSGETAGAQQHMSEATQTYDAAAARTAAGTLPTGGGVIQQSAINQIKKRHPEWTDAQVVAQLNSSKESAKQTMSNTGLGTGQDPAQQSLRNNPRTKNAAAAKAASDAEISNVKGYNSVPVYDDKGNIVGYNQVEDAAKTAQMQADAKAAATAKAAADANYAASLNQTDEQNTTPGAMGAETEVEEEAPPPNPDAFLAGLDAMERQYAGTTMAPLFEFYKGQYASLQAKGLRGEQLMAAIQKRTDAYVTQQKADMKNMESAWTKVYDDNLKGQLASAARTYDQQTRLAEQERDQEQLEFERTIRDQNIKNEEDRQSLLLTNGISSGWRSSMHTAKMINAFKKAENTIADLRGDKINNGKEWTNKLINVEQSFHGNVTAAYDAHNVNLLTLQDKLSERAREMDKTIYSNDIEQMKGVNSLTDMWYDGVSKIAEETTKVVIQAEQNAIEEAKSKRLELRQEQSDFRQRYQFHIGTYGSTDSAGYSLLVDEARELGISIPASAPETLEQKAEAMKELGSGISTERKGTSYTMNGANLNSVVGTIVARLPQGRDAKTEAELYGALESGDMNGFMNKAIDAGLEGLPVGLRNEYSSATAGLGNTATAMKLMAGIESTSIYKKLYNENLSAVLAQNKDQEWLQALGTAQLAQAELVKQLIGVAQTDGEASRLAEFLPAAGDSVADSITKLRTSYDYFQRKYDNVATQALGLGYGTTVRNGQIVNLSAPPEAEEGGDEYGDDPGMGEPMSQNNTGFGSPTAMSSNSSAPREITRATARKQSVTDWMKSMGVKTAGYDSDHVKIAHSEGGGHGGLDVAGPKGTPIKPLIGGKVVSMAGSNKDKKGWGLSITIQDSEGIFHKYSHLDGVAPEVKAALERGEMPLVTPDMEVAYMGNSGNVIPGKGGKGVHLDYRARRADGKWIRIEDEYRAAPSQTIAANF